MRFVGQNYERDVPLPAGSLSDADLARVVELFHRYHKEAYGYDLPGEPIELVHFDLTASGATRTPDLPGVASGSLPEPAKYRDVWFRGSVVATPVFRRDTLPANAVLSGPAVIEEPNSTTLVLPGDTLTVEPTGVLKITREPSPGRADRHGGSATSIDSVSLSIFGDQLVAVTQEMGLHMMRTSYSPIFSESRDFSCALFDKDGQMVAQGPFCPAQLGAISETVRCVLNEIGVDAFGPGDVVLHNDPYRGGCHMPEHMLLGPIFAGDNRVGFAATIGHFAEIGAATIGSFVSDATEVYQEGLRLPPVKLVRGGELVPDVWRIILANHRTPRNTWGDLHAMIGSLREAERHVKRLIAKYGESFVLEAFDALLEHGDRMMGRQIEAIRDGEYHFEDLMEDDGISDAPSRIRVCVTIDGDRAIIDYTGSDPQAAGPINATFGVTTSATYNAFLQLSQATVPRNAGAYRRLTTIAPVGSVVNVKFPGPSVGGNTETQPKLVGMLLGALSEALPERVMAAEGVTSCNFLFGGIDPRDGETYAHYHFEASGWGGRADGDGNSAQNHIHGNCRNTPVEVFEKRFPVRVLAYELVCDSGGPGAHRGGLAVRRRLQVLAPVVTASAMMDRVKAGAWGLFGGLSGRCASIAVLSAGRPEYESFQKTFGTVSPSKFAGVKLQSGDEVMIESAGGGGYGMPRVRNAELVLQDVRDGFVSIEAARREYGVVIRGNGSGLELDRESTTEARGGAEQEGVVNGPSRSDGSGNERGYVAVGPPIASDDSDNAESAKAPA
jgi:N-methylhydantoinase B/oxoprolinase/acetone carboxylase alpha subunit